MIIEYFQRIVNIFLCFFQNQIKKGVMDTENILVYDNIRNKAKKAGISINYIEKKANLAIGSICKWNTVSPTAKSLLSVAQILGCTVDDLLKSG